ncbi:MAG: RodZ domain-containing protein [Alphaproteobacteria bacterium]
MPEPTAGSYLQETRLHLGYEIQEVADALRIRRTHLEALEEGRYDDLPGRAYALGFFRSYAEFLGLDSAEIIERFKSEAKSAVKQPSLDFPAPAAEAKMPRAWLVILVLVLAGLAYGGWQYVSKRDDMPREAVLDVPEHLIEPEAAETSPASLHDAALDSQALDGVPEADDDVLPAPVPALEATDAPETAEGAVPSGEDGGALAAGSEPSPDAADPAAPEALPSFGAESEPAETITLVPPEPAPTDTSTEAAADVARATVDSGYVPQVYGRANANARIVIVATDDSWVQVWGPNDELLLTRILHEGDVYNVPNRQGLVLMTGNAGGLEVWVDAKRLGELGPSGTVRRDIVLDPGLMLQQLGNAE